MRTHLIGFLVMLSCCTTVDAQQLSGTEPLTMEGDIASELVAGVDRFLLREIDKSGVRRERYWKRDLSSHEAYNKSIEPNRKRLAHMLGTRGELVPFKSPKLIATVDEINALTSDGDELVVAHVRWPVVDGLMGEGILLSPTDDVRADAVLIPDADQTPEQFAEEVGTKLAAGGCRVLILRTVSRERAKRNGRAILTNREFLHRSAFELGRTLIGYETHMVLAAVNWFSSDEIDRPIGVLGHGEGGMAALFAGALDTRIDLTSVSGFFGPREKGWQEPLDRNVFGLLDEFGGAELVSMITPRKLRVTNGAGSVMIADDGTAFEDGGPPGEITNPGPQVTIADNGAAPALIRPVPQKAVIQELTRARKLVLGLPRNARWFMTGVEGYGGRLFAAQLRLKRNPELPELPKFSRSPKQAQADLVAHIDKYNQRLLDESRFVRKEFMKKLDTSSIEAYEKSVEPYREHFARKTIGKFPYKMLPFNPRTRRKYDEEKWTGHEVVLDVFPDVMAYGILLLPKGMKPDEKRPVVVCQHGLEGRPADTIEGDHGAYHDFAAKLCERGYIVFAPQNLYIFQDRFRTLQRKANTIGKTLFSIIVPQHQQIVNWLKTLPNVDSKRIAFYGLSYGGKSAMRIPPLVPDYCLSICSADFNEWVRKNATTRENFSYVWTGEYEIFEFDLGSTFNYAEMAALIAPRPFMVERGHFDGVGIDEWVAFEFAKVRNLYATKLKIPDRCEIEWFDGPHTINGKGTFDFLDRHLKWQPK